MPQQSEEVYECAGCAGEVSIVDAIWLPDNSMTRA